MRPSARSAYEAMLLIVGVAVAGLVVNLWVNYLVIGRDGDQAVAHGFDRRAALLLAAALVGIAAIVMALGALVDDALEDLAMLATALAAFVGVVAALWAAGVAASHHVAAPLSFVAAGAFALLPGWVLVSDRRQLADAPPAVGMAPEPDAAEVDPEVAGADLDPAEVGEAEVGEADPGGGEADESAVDHGPQPTPVGSTRRRLGDVASYLGRASDRANRIVAAVSERARRTDRVHVLIAVPVITIVVVAVSVWLMFRGLNQSDTLAQVAGEGTDLWGVGFLLVVMVAGAVLLPTLMVAAIAAFQPQFQMLAASTAAGLSTLAALWYLFAASIADTDYWSAPVTQAMTRTGWLHLLPALVLIVGLVVSRPRRQGEQTSEPADR